ncbi:MAG: ribose ABC transporter permease, partial [Propionivibrio sp.]
MNNSVSVPLDQKSRRIRHLLADYGIVIAFFVLCVGLTVSSEYFLTWGNWVNILRQTSINGILAIGMTYVILTKGIDLSVGSVLALGGLVTGSLV